MVSLGVKTHGRDSLPYEHETCKGALGCQQICTPAGRATEGGVKFEFDVRRAMTEMTAIYTVCLHTVQTVPWYR